MTAITFWSFSDKVALTSQWSLCDAPIDMRLCGPGLRKPSDRPVLTAALCCLMFYLFELMAKTRGFKPPIKEPMFLPRRSVKQRQFCCVTYRT